MTDLCDACRGTLKTHEPGCPRGEKSMTHSARAREIYAKWCDVDDFKLDADLIPLITAALRDVEIQTYAHAKRLAEALAAKHFPANTGWQPLDDAIGVIDQIDNMTTALVHKDRLADVELQTLERAAKVVLATSSFTDDFGIGYSAQIASRITCSLLLKENELLKKYKGALEEKNQIFDALVNDLRATLSKGK